VQSKYDESVFLVYVDGGILAGPSAEHINDIIAKLKESYNMTDEEGDITDYLGVHMKLFLPHLIDQIMKEEVNFQSNTKPRLTHVQSTKILNKDEDRKSHNASWHYSSVIGNLNSLETCRGGKSAYSVYQCPNFFEDPKVSYSTDAVHHILVQYLMGTQDEEIIIDPTKMFLRVRLMPTSVDYGTEQPQLRIQAQQNCKLAISFHLQNVQSCGHQNWKRNIL
jgi:hypothetical protein